MEYKDHPCGISSTGTSVRHTWGIKTTPVVTRDNGTFSETNVGYRDHVVTRRDQRWDQCFLFSIHSPFYALSTSVALTSTRFWMIQLFSSALSAAFGRSFLDPEYSFVAVPRIPWTRFVKQQVFVQLWTNSVGLGLMNTPNYKCLPS